MLCPVDPRRCVIGRLCLGDRRWRTSKNKQLARCIKRTSDTKHCVAAQEKDKDSMFEKAFHETPLIIRYRVLSLDARPNGMTQCQSNPIRIEQLVASSFPAHHGELLTHFQSPICLCCYCFSQLIPYFYGDNVLKQEITIWAHRVIERVDCDQFRSRAACR